MQAPLPLRRKIMNTLTPKKVLKLTEKNMQDAMQNALANTNSYASTIGDDNIYQEKVERREPGFFIKLGVFLRWGSYTITLLVAALCTYIGFYGYPPALRHIELQFIESKVDEVAKSLSHAHDRISDVEDKVTLQQIAIDKELKKKNK